jgi:magnesium transporter
MVLGIALFFATISSVVTGLIIPYLFGKLKLDPANASGPIATTLQDVFSVLVYFTVALLIL